VVIDSYRSDGRSGGYIVVSWWSKVGRVSVPRWLSCG